MFQQTELSIYTLLEKLSIIFILNLQTKILPAKYIMKTDDDAFVRIDEVISSLKGKATNGLLYGLIAFESAPDREKGSKWYIDNKVLTSNFFLYMVNVCFISLWLDFDECYFAQEWPHALYPPWAHGPGYIISRDIAKFIVRGHQESDLKVKLLMQNATSKAHSSKDLHEVCRTCHFILKRKWHRISLSFKTGHWNTKWGM